MTKALPILLLTAAAASGDWTDWRGPNRDGQSAEKNLPTSWSPNGQNLAWKLNVGARSTPVVQGDHLYLLTTAGAGASLQERLVCVNADSGKLLWEKKWNVYHSDVPPHRIAWSAPAIDPATGNVYVYGVGGDLYGFAKDGKQIFHNSLVEMYGIVTTHGGRTVSPVVDGDLVIVSNVSTGWGDQARAAHRFFAFDKNNGEPVYGTTPGGRPFDTTYAPPIIAEIGGQRLFIAGGGDGQIHAIKPQTGEPVWKFPISKRGVNTGVVVNGSTVYVSHSEENFDTSEMGMLAAIDGSAKGDLGKQNVKWSIPGFQGSFSSPVIDGDRFIELDASANVFAFDLVTGKQIWKKNLGTIQRASAVLADGKIYVGTENGKFFILKPHNDRCEVLSEVAFVKPGVPEEDIEKVIAAVAISEGRVFLATTHNLYAIGKKVKAAPTAVPMPKGASADAKPAAVQVRPAEIWMRPGESRQLKVKLYDDKGQFIKDSEATWSLANLGGTVSGTGNYTAGSDMVGQAGVVKATVGGISGTARVRVLPPFPLSEDFEKWKPETAPPHWINTTGKYQVRQEEGNKVLVKLADNPFTKRARSFFGPLDSHDYSVQADVRAATKRRQQGDAGVVAQGYQLVLFGNAEKLELNSWQPETTRRKETKFTWKPETWYRMKLEVTRLGGDKVRARGKAWAAADPEPSDWMVETIDAVGNIMGSPGVYADALFEVFFDNIVVMPNK